MKKFLAFFLAVVMAFSMSATAFASASGDDPSDYPMAELVDSPVIMPRAVAGYAHRVALTGTGSFEVNVTGSMSATAGLTFKTECDSNNAMVVIDIQRPNGIYMLTDSAFGANEERQYGFALATTGKYIIYYNVLAPTDAIHMQCWIY